MIADRENALIKMSNNKDSNPAIGLFDNMHHPPISEYLSKEDIFMLSKLAIDAKYNGVTKESKFDVYDAILNNKHFERFHLGTNRIVYRHIFDPRFLLKIAIDPIGITANIKEYKNQFLLKPFIPKVFDISSSGAVQMCERVKPFTHKEEFIKYGKEVFDAIQCILKGNRYILEDIGTNFFMNWGLREGFGPVILDFPYIYVRQPDRMRCISPNKHSKGLCGGIIDYDDGYNELVCCKCGQRYAAKDLGSDPNYLIDREMAKSKVNAKEGYAMTENISFIIDYEDEKGNKRTIHESGCSDNIPDSFTSGIMGNRKGNRRPYLEDSGDVIIRVVPTEETKETVDEYNVPIEYKQIPISIDMSGERVDGNSLLIDAINDASINIHDRLINQIEEFEKRLKYNFIQMSPKAYMSIKIYLDQIKDTATTIKKIDEENKNNSSDKSIEADGNKVKFTDSDSIVNKMDFRYIDAKYPQTKTIINSLYDNDCMIYTPRGCIDFKSIANVIDDIIEDKSIAPENKSKEIYKKLSPESGIFPSYITTPYIDENALKNAVDSGFEN